MSNKELDNLFKNKLESINKKPGADAWGKINDQIEGGNKKGFPYIKVAAAVLFLLTFSFTLRFMVTDNEPENIISGNTDTTSQQTEGDNMLAEKSQQKELNTNAPQVKREVNNGNDIKSDSQSTLDNSTEQFDKNLKGDRDKSTVEPRNKIPEKIESQERSEFIAEASEVESIGDTAVGSVEKSNVEAKGYKEETFEKINISDATNQNQTASTKQMDETKTDGTTIELSLSEFEKTKVAQQEPVQNETNQDTVSGFKKILNVMEDVGIGDLRKAKNELFAFNAKKNRNDNSK